MTASDIARRLARKLDIPHKDAQSVLRALTSSIVSLCLSTDRLEIRGFGTFSAVRRRARPARDFKTGSAISVPDRLALKFKPSKAASRTTSPG